MIRPLVDKYPDYLDLKLVMAQYNLWDDKPDEALNYAKLILAKDPNFEEAHLIALKACNSKNDANCFEKQSKEYLEIYPDSSHVIRRNQASLYAQNKKHREARDLLLSLKDSFPNDTEIDVEIATYSFWIGDYDTSITYANKAIDKYVTRNDAHLIAIKNCMAMKDDTCFDKQAEKYLSVYPDSSKNVIELKAGMLMEQAKYKEVIELNDSLPKMNPPDSSLVKMAHLAKLNSTYHLLGPSFSYWFIGNDPSWPRIQGSLDYLYKLDKVWGKQVRKGFGEEDSKKQEKNTGLIRPRAVKSAPTQKPAKRVATRKLKTT